MSVYHILTSCLRGDYDSSQASTSNSQNDEDVAVNIVDLLYGSEKNGRELKTKLRQTIQTYSWSENLAIAILNATEYAVGEGRAMSPTIQEAYDKVCDAATAVGGFVQDHPVFCTVVAIGILVLFFAWVIEFLGFAAEGPVAGECSIIYAWRSC